MWHFFLFDFLWIYIIIQVCFSLLKYLFCWINTDISIPQSKWGELWKINKCTACRIDLNLFRGVKSWVFSQGKLLMHSCKNIQVMKQHEQIFLMVKWYMVMNCTCICYHLVLWSYAVYRVILALCNFCPFYTCKLPPVLNLPRGLCYFQSFAYSLKFADWWCGHNLRSKGEFSLVYSMY